MKILLVTFVYNELPYIKEMINFYKDLDIYVIDNYSTDGTYEWLIDNEIECHRFDTKETFHLDLLQKELERVLHIKKPDWFVYAHPDLFYVFDKSIRETIKEAEEKGFNQLSVKCYGALNTGEYFSLPLYTTFQYGAFYRPLQMISKYDKTVRMNGDNIVLTNAKPMETEGIMVNYGACKPIEEQKVKLERRRKAWYKGLSTRTGKHFAKYEKVNWTWTKDQCIKFTETEDVKYFLKLTE